MPVVLHLTITHKCFQSIKLYIGVQGTKLYIDFLSTNCGKTNCFSFHNITYRGFQSQFFKVLKIYIDFQGTKLGESQLTIRHKGFKRQLTIRLYVLLPLTIRHKGFQSTKLYTGFPGTKLYIDFWDIKLRENKFFCI